VSMLRELPCGFTAGEAGAYDGGWWLVAGHWWVVAGSWIDYGSWALVAGRWSLVAGSW